MLSKSFAWQLTRMNSDGSANLAGNTRVTDVPGTDEVVRSGYDKNYDYKSTIYVIQKKHCVMLYLTPFILI
jgi:hypothetical protein